MEAEALLKLLYEKNDMIGEKRVFKVKSDFRDMYNTSQYGTLGVNSKGEPDIKIGQATVPSGISYSYHNGTDSLSMVEDSVHRRCSSFAMVEAQFPTLSKCRIAAAENAAELFLFKGRKEIVLVNPSHGSIYRAIESKINAIYYHLTDSTYIEEFEEWVNFLDWGQCTLRRCDPRHVFRYHGSNGFRAGDIYPESVALELNPFSSMARDVCSAIVAVEGGINVVYKRKERRVEIFVPNFPELFFRYSAYSFSYDVGYQGNMFNFLSIKDPSSYGLKILSPPPPLGIVPNSSYSFMPPYDDKGISRDDTFLYDILSSATVSSRRQSLYDIAPSMGLSVAPFSSCGSYWFSLVDHRFQRRNFSLDGDFVLCSDNENFCISVFPFGVEGKKVNSVFVFIKDYFRGTVVNHLSSLGSVVERPLYMFPGGLGIYDEPWLRKRSCTVFESMDSLLFHASFIVSRYVAEGNRLTFEAYSLNSFSLEMECAKGLLNVADKYIAPDFLEGSSFSTDSLDPTLLLRDDCISVDSISHFSSLFNVRSDPVCLSSDSLCSYETVRSVIESCHKLDMSVSGSWPCPSCLDMFQRLKILGIEVEDSPILAIDDVVLYSATLLLRKWWYEEKRDIEGLM